MEDRFVNGLKFRKVEGAKPRPVPPKLTYVQMRQQKQLEIQKKNTPPKIEVFVPEKLRTGTFLQVSNMFDKVAGVYLNGYALSPKVDYQIKGNCICFSFNVRKSEKLIIEGVLSQ